MPCHCSVSLLQYFPVFLVEFSNVLDGSKPARTLLAALSVTLLASSELIDMVIYDLLKIFRVTHKLREP